MELETTFIGLVAIALCIVPLVLMHRSRKKKEEDLINGLKSIADSNNSDVAIYDIGIEISIGLSIEKNLVFFYKRTNEQVSEQCVALNSIKKCQIDTAQRTIKTNDGNESVIDKLELVLCPKDKSIAPYRFEFYNSDERFQLKGELQLIRKWQSLIKNNL